MRGVNDVLEVLNDLSAQDRTWLLDHLPAEAKSHLLSLSPADEADVSTRTPEKATNASLRQQEDSIRRVAAADVNALARLLVNEPAWVVGVLLCIRQWSWRSELLRLLPPSIRIDVERGAYTKCQPSARLSQQLLQRIADKLDRQPPARAPSKFEVLLERLAARTSDRRSTTL